MQSADTKTFNGVIKTCVPENVTHSQQPQQAYILRMVLGSVNFILNSDYINNKPLAEILKSELDSPGRNKRSWN